MIVVTVTSCGIQQRSCWDAGWFGYRIGKPEKVKTEAVAFRNFVYSYDNSNRDGNLECSHPRC